MVAFSAALLALGANAVLAAYAPLDKRVTNTLCKGGPPAVAASILSAFAPAQSFCSSKYPLPTTTSTITAPTATNTVTGPPSSVTITTGTTTQTITDTTATSVETDTETDTATATITVTAGMKRRNARASSLGKRILPEIAVRPSLTDVDKRAAATTVPNTCIAGSRSIQGKQCTTQCGVDRTLSPYSHVFVSAFEGCVQACAADKNCVTAQYHEGSNGGNCYLKSKTGTSSKASGVDTVDCGPVNIPLSILSSVQAGPTSFLASLCTCLETQPTQSITVTPSATVTATPLSTTDVVETDTAHVSSTTQTTTQTTTTTTVVATATVQPAISCTGNGGNQCVNGASFSTSCDTLYSAPGYTASSQSTQSSGAACLQACDNDANCNLFQFVPSSSSSGTCSLYDNVPDGTDLQDTPVPGDYSGFYVASC